MPAHGQQTTTDTDSRRDEAPALPSIANPRRIRWSTRSQQAAGTPAD